jgi:hypothetical protein
MAIEVKLEAMEVVSIGMHFDGRGPWGDYSGHGGEGVKVAKVARNGKAGDGPDVTDGADRESGEDEAGSVSEMGERRRLTSSS